MLKRLGRSQIVRELAGALAAGYLHLIRATTRFVYQSPVEDILKSELPIIVAMWHGQHLMVHFATFPGAQFAALISRSADGEVAAQIMERIGVHPIRGSGGPVNKSRKRGGAEALRAMLRELKQGRSIALTADVPKVSRIAGAGIVTLAQLSGRPIYPVAAVNSRRIDLRTWDHASVPLPFGRAALILGDAIEVPRDATPELIEAKRQDVENALNDLHRRAYAKLGLFDPVQAKGQTA
jgi:lysophospholipid acyltransferase (LPLAT)-like uncharacterized protein